MYRCAMRQKVSFYGLRGYTAYLIHTVLYNVICGYVVILGLISI